VALISILTCSGLLLIGALVSMRLKRGGSARYHLPFMRDHHHHRGSHDQVPSDDHAYEGGRELELQGGIVL
jgi:hypothetical protein